MVKNFQCVRIVIFCVSRQLHYRGTTVTLDHRRDQRIGNVKKQIWMHQYMS